ncbi:MAG: hypothetical protein FJ308_00290 [Planctomycetes bacterium]|nr:hypothetical protein [Planctomycetota bacterium]
MLLVTTSGLGCRDQSSRDRQDGATGTETHSEGSDSKTTHTAGRTETSGGEHEHQQGAHGGIMVSLGQDSYHVEAVLGSDNKVRLYMLGRDETRVIDIPAGTLKGFVQLEGDVQADSIEFQPEPQDGDAEGRTSCFTGSLPDRMLGRDLMVTIPNVAIDGERFRLSFQTHSADHSDSEMPSKATDDEEEVLYTRPGGVYTQADIAANGNQTPGQRYRGIRSKHDRNPKPGDRICPVTKTKANPQFEWTVGGKKYTFCCPPCIDEFVRNAKESTTPLPEPDAFTQQEEGR